MTRIVVVPSTLALLPEYTSIEDPIAELRAAVTSAVGWLVEEGPAGVLAGGPAAERIGQHLLQDRLGDGPGLLVVANGSARRTEKAPGHLDDRALPFDAAIGKALADGDLAALAGIDLALAGELWAMPDAEALRTLGRREESVTSAQVDYDDDPFGVQYWVVRWQCR